MLANYWFVSCLYNELPASSLAEPAWPKLWSRRLNSACTAKKVPETFRQFSSIFKIA